MLITSPLPADSWGIGARRSDRTKAHWRGCKHWQSAAASVSTTHPSSTPAQPAADGMQNGAGPSCGMLPNIHVRSISMDTLRAHPAFEALPPVDDLMLSHPQCYRYVRQDSPLWRALHAGVLTSSTLNGALGVHEPCAIAQLGLPKHFASHGSLLAAAANLRQPQHVPSAPAPLLSLAEAHWLNREAVVAHNAAGQDTSHTQPGPNQHALRQRSSTGGRRKKEKGAVQPAAGDAKRRATAVALAERGAGSIRMAWGSAQEAASVHALLQVFPDATVGEVGLCMVDWDALPREWGIRAELLPPMGASPDAMLRHRSAPAATVPPLSSLSSPAPAVQPAQSGTVEGSTAVAAEPSTAGVPAQPVTDAAVFVNGLAAGCQAPSPECLPTEWGMRLCSELDMDLRAPRPARHPQPRRTVQAVVQPTTLAADIEALLQRLQLSTQKKQRPDPLALVSATAAVATAPNFAPNTAAAAAKKSAQPHLQPRPQAAGAAAAQVAAEAGEGLEMVEVKNTCPFAAKPRLSRKGKQRMQYILADKGPRMQVPSYWVAQLQMEMLASNTSSIILLSRSATKGSNVFRMQRDDTFLRLMLCCIQQLMEQYVLPGVQPAPNCFASDLQHQQLYSRILHVVASTSVLAHVPYITPHPAATDTRYFLD